jgi:hypothetical protein
MTEPERVPEPEDIDPTARASGATEAPAAGDPGPGLPPPTAVESLVGALLEAGPEVAEHVVRAAQELLLVVQVIVDAADRAVQEQHRVHAETARAAAVPDAPFDRDGDADDVPGPVRHLDIAE